MPAQRTDCVKAFSETFEARTNGRQSLGMLRRPNHERCFAQSGAHFSKKKGAAAPFCLNEFYRIFSLILALAFEIFELAALPFDFQLILIDLLVLARRLIVTALQLVADQRPRA